MQISIGALVSVGAGSMAVKSRLDMDVKRMTPGK
jgi:hypothetical protein